MKLATYKYQSTVSIGRVEGDYVLDLSAALPAGCTTMLDVLRAGPALIEQLEDANLSSARKLRLGEVELAAPIANPSKFLAIGLNYQDHLEEVLARAARRRRASCGSTSKCLVSTARTIQFKSHECPIDWITRRNWVWSSANAADTSERRARWTSSPAMW